MVIVAIVAYCESQNCKSIELSFAIHIDSYSAHSRRHLYGICYEQIPLSRPNYAAEEVEKRTRGTALGDCDDACPVLFVGRFQHDNYHAAPASGMDCM